MVFEGQMTVLLWILACNYLLVLGYQPKPRHVCLTGTMMDVQNWVHYNGQITDNIDPSEVLDLSTVPNPSTSVIANFYHDGDKRFRYTPIRYLSLARCKLTRVPPIFDSFEDSQGRNLSKTLEYLSLYGNMFVDVSIAGQQYDVRLNAVNAVEVDSGTIKRGQVRSMWSSGFQRVKFQNLRELDLRYCGISTLDAYIFQNMPELEALYLSDNSVHTISSSAFIGLSKLKHLDLSSNSFMQRDENPVLLLLENDVFSGLENLTSLDFSNTLINFRRVSAVKSLGVNVERLSLCHTGIQNLPSCFFKDASIKFLDVSGNHGVLLNPGVLEGLEDSLKVIYASEVGLNSFDIFENFSKLEILRLSNNEISYVKKRVASSLNSLQALDLRRNRITNWFTDTYAYIPSLKLLDVRNNMITIISSEMLKDVANVSFLALSGNSIVCNCYSREFMELAVRNEVRIPITYLKPRSREDPNSRKRFAYHSAFDDINLIISSRQNISYIRKSLGREIELLAQGDFLLLDYSRGKYVCSRIAEGRTKTPFMNVEGCLESYEGGLPPELRSGRMQLLALLAIPGLLLPSILIGFIFRRNLRYCYVTMRNSALLSMVNKNKVINEDTMFNYDVFVSYCNEDRPWVLDQLLSHLETDCSVSLCLHERDFQVGLSILENIVSCMDRSKSIMLVISQKFLLSQWCQFEMHLAQHRLLETRREDLILILLEDIPRRLRPNTLHYLMLTKTYIVWPKNKAEQHLFWKRLKKSVTTQKHKHDRVSLA